MTDKITIFTREQLKGSDNVFNPVAKFRHDISLLMDLMQEMASITLTEEEYLRATAIAIDAFSKNENLSLFSLVNAWKVEPVLVYFAKSVSKFGLPGVHGKHFES